jgi:hypothetical protein
MPSNIHAMAALGDPTNLLGMSRLANPDKIKHTNDMESIERQVTEGLSRLSTDPTNDDFTMRIDSVLKSMGGTAAVNTSIDSGFNRTNDDDASSVCSLDLSAPPPAFSALPSSLAVAPAPSPATHTVSHTVNPSDSVDQWSRNTLYGKEPTPSSAPTLPVSTPAPVSQPEPDPTPVTNYDGLQSATKPMGSSSYTGATTKLNHDSNRLLNSSPTAWGSGEELLTNNYTGDLNAWESQAGMRVNIGEPTDPSYAHMTKEQAKQRLASNVLRDLDENDPITITIERENQEDQRALLLEQIDMLCQSLEEDNDIKLSDNLKTMIATAPKRPLNEVELVYRILTIKSDRYRYASLAEEGILAIAGFAGSVFNGEREFWGFRPDLTGWDSTVGTKLRRCRYETSSILSDVMEDMNIGRGTRIALELVPSAFLHARARAKRRKEQDKVSRWSDTMGAARDVTR